jgi:hypothetical protein
MRWLACSVLLAGCLRARATVVHPTELVRTSSDSGSTTAIARTTPAASEVPQVDDSSTNLISVELGALIPFGAHESSAHIHVAPGVRIFGSQASSPLWGVAVGADFVGKGRGPGFALEGSVHVGNGGNDPEIIDQALDVFAGVTVHASRRTSTSIAIGPSVGVLGMPGGHSVVMVGLGLRLTGGPK